MLRRYRRLFALLVVILLVVVGYFTVPLIFGDIVVPLPEEYQPIITKYSKDFGVDSCLVAAVIRGESTWNPKAGSYAGAQGLMQLMPATADAISRRFFGEPFPRSRLHNPEDNIRLGTRLLRYNIDAYRSLRNVLVAYNAGGGRVGLPDSRLPRETRFYITKITRYYNLYRSVYPQFCTGPNLLAGETSRITPNDSAPLGDLPDFVIPEQNNTNFNINDFWKNWL